jgi:hypothetical protein
MVKERREGYQVGVFKDGKLKHIMKLQEGQHYIKEKTKKIKESKPKRECSKAQLEALARGRALREQKKAALEGGGSSRGSIKKERSSLVGSSGKSSRAISAPKPKTKNIRYAKDQKSQTRKKTTKANLRREKEMNEGKHRKYESQYNSDSDHGDDPRHVDYDDDEVTE